MTEIGVNLQPEHPLPELVLGSHVKEPKPVYWKFCDLCGMGMECIEYTFCPPPGCPACWTEDSWGKDYPYGPSPSGFRSS